MLKGKHWLLIFLLLCAQSVYAVEFVVATHSHNLKPLTATQVRMLYRGLISNVNGSTVNLTDLPQHSAIRKEFYISLLGKTPIQMQALRARQNFSGMSLPPYELISDEKSYVLDWLKENPDNVAYIPKSWANDSLNIIYQLNSEDTQ
ncbi:hypothetical protein [Vibrio viridaestus]|uniref:DUF2066 domain-containing protein n=1 Tax=Vibrio viridaestus TaxID=2487322 RepID=A0A3N9TEZ9_9VIBR|nr:hypothetical protein [Vibrio viridaestus]RQW62699.1 hypothetical protein EES38_13310 [Vibrio viridaestus]